MKKSTILVVSTLVLVGAGAFLYFKNKKASGVVADNSSALDSTSATTSKASVPSGVSGTTNTVTKEATPSTDEQKNYLRAKDLARILWLHNAKVLDKEYKLLLTKEGYSTIPLAFTAIKNSIVKRINSLGYKVLPNYEIEKM